MPLPLPSKLTSDRLGQSTLALPVYRVTEEGGVEQLLRRQPAGDGVVAGHEAPRSCTKGRGHGQSPHPADVGRSWIGQDQHLDRPLRSPHQARCRPQSHSRHDFHQEGGRRHAAPHRKASGATIAGEPSRHDVPCLRVPIVEAQPGRGRASALWGPSSNGTILLGKPSRRPGCAARNLGRARRGTSACAPAAVRKLQRGSRRLCAMERVEGARRQRRQHPRNRTIFCIAGN
jgi:hypothetical protein